MQNLFEDLSQLHSYRISPRPPIWQSRTILQSRIELQPRMRLQAVLAQLLVWEQRSLLKHFSRILTATKFHIHPQLYKNSQEKCKSRPSSLKTHALRQRATYTAPADSLSSLLGFPRCYGCAIVVARVLHTDPPDGEVASLHKAIGRHWTRRVRPNHLWLWVTTHQRALHSDVVTRVDHQCLIDRQLQSRWSWKSTKRHTSELKKDPSNCLCAASYFLGFIFENGWFE